MEGTIYNKKINYASLNNDTSSNIYKEIINSKNLEQKLINNHETSLSLRKKKIEETINKQRTFQSKNFSKEEFGHKELSDLKKLAKSLLDENDENKVNNILDKICIFLMTFNKTIPFNLIQICNIIPYLYIKIQFLTSNDDTISKIFDIFKQIIRLTPNEIIDNYIHIFNPQYFKLIIELINIQQNNNFIMGKIFDFLTSVLEKSDLLRQLLSTEERGYYFLRCIFSLDTKYPVPFLQFLSAFHNLILDDVKNENFQLLLIEECDKILSSFYRDNHEEPKDVINNRNIFVNLYKCLTLMSSSDNKKVLDIFLVNQKDNCYLYKKILAFEKFDSQFLCEYVIKITGNLFCSDDTTHIENLIECGADNYIIESLRGKKLNKNNIISSAAWALSDFVLHEKCRKIFIEKNYINDLISVLISNGNYDVTMEILYTIVNLLTPLNEIEIVAFITSKICESCTAILMSHKDLKILILNFKIIDLLLGKIYTDDNSQRKIINPYKIKFDYCNLKEILNNISCSSEYVEKVSETAEYLLEKYFKNDYS